MSAQRTQFQADDVSNPENLRRVLNDYALDIATRLEALERLKGLTVLPEVTFETDAAIGTSTAPFTQDGAGLRVSCPFTPTGLVLLSLVRTMPAGAAVSGSASDVKWHYAAGAAGGAGDGAIHIDFVTGLSASSRYVMRLGVTRA